MSDLNVNTIGDALDTGSPDFPNGMPTVGGDPIVESGSNSDGEWMRWADGSLANFIKKSISFTFGAVDSGYRAPVSDDLFWPQPFSDATSDVRYISDSLESAQDWPTKTSIGTLTVAPSYWIQSNIGSSDSGSLTITAFGRWK